MLKNKRVVCAMSGGVDSSVAAALLKNQGYDVIGVFLLFTRTLNTTNTNTKHHKSFENICCNQEALRSARVVAEKLKIPFYVLDASKEFKKQVVDYYINEYDSGRTPNPCVRCNKFIKFGWLLKKAKELGADYLASGHYARTKKLKLFKARDLNKDQSYFLWQLGQDQLKRILFPIGNYKKSQVRAMAKKWGLPTAQKKESQDICFVPDDNYSFLKKYAKKLNKTGDITDLKGHILGQHKGLTYYTIGQRHGLMGIQLKFPISNLACRQTGFQFPNKSQISNLKSQTSGFRPAYVVELDTKNNRLIVGEEKNLYSKELIADDVNWIDLHIARTKCQAKIRYGHPAAKCKIQKSKFKHQIKVIFDKPQGAITPGQSIVFYRNKEILGGGIIK